MKSNLSLLDRLQLPVSPDFKPLLYAGLILFTLSTALVGLQTNLTDFGLPVPVWIVTVSKYVAVISATVSGLCGFTVDGNAPQTRDRISINSLNAALKKIVEKPGNKP